MSTRPSCDGHRLIAKIGCRHEPLRTTAAHSRTAAGATRRRGRLDLLIFTPAAELTQRLAMSAASPVVQIPRGIWHGGVALESQTLVMEVKPGPYRPNEFADWGPEEGEAASGAFVRWAKAADVGAKWQTPASGA